MEKTVGNKVKPVEKVNVNVKKRPDSLKALELVFTTCSKYGSDENKLVEKVFEVLEKNDFDSLASALRNLHIKPEVEEEEIDIEGEEEEEGSTTPTKKANKASEEEHQKYVEGLLAKCFISLPQEHLRSIDKRDIEHLFKKSANKREKYIKVHNMILHSGSTFTLTTFLSGFYLHSVYEDEGSKAYNEMIKDGGFSISKCNSHKRIWRMFAAENTFHLFRYTSGCLAILDKDGKKITDYLNNPPADIPGRNRPKFLKTDFWEWEHDHFVNWKISNGTYFFQCQQRARKMTK